MKRGSLTGIARILGTFGLALLISGPLVLADQFTFTASPNTKRFHFKGGESQSAVVAPGKKAQCPNGRIFVSDEHRHPPVAIASINPVSDTTDVVHWRNLPGPKKIIPGEGVSLFFSPGATVNKGPLSNTGQPQQAPSSGHLKSWGWDHQLVSLPNGDLIYQRAMLSKAPINTRPDWWDFSFRDGFGPGARSTLATWRSTDCGETFEYISEINSYGSKYEECANPRNLGNDEKPIISMGGTDGPNLVVDRDDGTAYAVFPCVGDQFKKGAQGEPVFGPAIAKTYVFSLKSGKKTFINRGAYQPNLWGPTAVPLSDNRLAVGMSGIGPLSLTGIMIGKAQSNTGLFSFLHKPVAVNGVSWGWDEPGSFPWKIPLKTDLRKHVSAGIAGNTVLARVPGKAEILLLAFPAMVEGKSKTKTHGFRVYYYHAKNDDPQNDQIVETDSIIPAGPAEKSMIMHLTAIDPGDGGPILLFWYDLNGNNKTARIRGRFIYTDQTTSSPFANIGESNDFDVALADGQSTEFSLESGGSYWFGDYKTAGGFKSPKDEAAPLFTVLTYRYFPVWIQPDGTVNYTEVTATRTIVKPLFEVNMSKEPFLKMFTECCDFIGLVEKAKVQKGDVSPEKRLVGEAAALASRLLIADPNLKDPKLWIGRKLIVKVQPRRTTLTTLEQSPVMRNMLKDYHEKSRSHIKQD
jgi:hypothetical protein